MAGGGGGGVVCGPIRRGYLTASWRSWDGPLQGTTRCRRRVKVKVCLLLSLAELLRIGAGGGGRCVVGGNSELREWFTAAR